MNYVEDYLFYNTGNECPPAFHLWSALTVLSTVVSRKVWLDRSYFTIYPNLYVCLVGTAGSGKSVAKDLAKNLIIEHFPTIPMSAAIQSREHIIQRMHEEPRLLQHDGKDIEYHPFALFINELSNFISVDPAKMVSFLVDIYDARYLDTGFKKDAYQNRIPNPYVTMLACTQPDWIMRNLKIELFSGGLGRRLIIVYERKTKCIDEPTIPPGGQEAWERIVNHLLLVEKLQGPMQMSEAARAWYKSWYESRKAPDDPILLQFHETKHVQLQKVAMLLALSHYPPRLIIEQQDFEVALALLNALEPSIPKLTAGVGRNVLAPAMQHVLDALEASDGCISEKRLLAILGRDVTLREFEELLNQLERMERIKRVIMSLDGVHRKFVVTPARFAEISRVHTAAQKKRAETQLASSNPSEALGSVAEAKPQASSEAEAPPADSAVPPSACKEVPPPE